MVQVPARFLRRISLTSVLLHDKRKYTIVRMIRESTNVHGCLALTTSNRNAGISYTYGLRFLYEISGAYLHDASPEFAVLRRRQAPIKID